MGMTLNIYIFMRALKMIIWFCLGASALAFLADFAEFSNRNSELPDFSVATAAVVVAMRVPFILQIAIPFIVLFATMATLMGLNQKYELVIARASGVSAWQFLRPIWLAAFLVGMFSILVINPLAASGFAHSEAVEGEWRSTPSQSLFASNQRPWIRQPGENGGTVLIGARRSSAVGTTLFDPTFLIINADGTLDRRIDGHRAELGTNVWSLTNTVTTRPDGRSESADRLDIPTTLDENIIKEALIPAEMVPFLSLPGQINAAQSFGIAASPFQMQYHSLIALPALLVVMTLIAATVSLRFARFGQSASMILSGIGAGFVLYVVTSVAKSFGNAGMVSTLLAAWLPVVAAGMFGVTFLLYREDG